MPHGIYELNGSEALSIEYNRRKLLDYYIDNGYEFVSPPIINFASHSSSFKFSDSNSNRTLEIVSDMSRQIAIIDDKHNQQQINKYCYAKQIVKPFADDFYSSRMPIQVGCEIYGDSDIRADKEVIITMINGLEKIGIKDVSLTIGDISILRIVIKHFALEDKAQEITKIFIRRSIPDLLNFISLYNLSCKKELINLMHGNLELIIQDFKSVKEITTKIENIIKLSKNINGINVLIDLASINTYNYHNGLIFSLYQAQFSKAIARGGRYDKSFSNREATGFSFDLKFLNSKIITNQ